MRRTIVDWLESLGDILTTRASAHVQRQRQQLRKHDVEATAQSAHQRNGSSGESTPGNVLVAETPIPLLPSGGSDDGGEPAAEQGTLPKQLSIFPRLFGDGVIVGPYLGAPRIIVMGALTFASPIIGTSLFMSFGVRLLISSMVRKELLDERMADWLRLLVSLASCIIFISSSNQQQNCWEFSGECGEEFIEYILSSFELCIILAQYAGFISIALIISYRQMISSMVRKVTMTRLLDERMVMWLLVSFLILFVGCIVYIQAVCDGLGDVGQCWVEGWEELIPLATLAHVLLCAVILRIRCMNKETQNLEAANEQEKRNSLKRIVAISLFCVGMIVVLNVSFIGAALIIPFGKFLPLMDFVIEKISRMCHRTDSRVVIGLLLVSFVFCIIYYRECYEYLELSDEGFIRLNGLVAVLLSAMILCIVGCANKGIQNLEAANEQGSRSQRDECAGIGEKDDEGSNPSITQEEIVIAVPVI